MPWARALSHADTEQKVEAGLKERAECLRIDSEYEFVAEKCEICKSNFFVLIVVLFIFRN